MFFTGNLLRMKSWRLVVLQMDMVGTLGRPRPRYAFSSLENDDGGEKAVLD